MISEVASQRAAFSFSGSASGTKAFAGDVTAGNLLILSGATHGSTVGTLNSVVSVTKASGTATIGSFTILQSSVGVEWVGQLNSFLAYALVSVGGTGSLTVGVTLTTSGGFNCGVDEFTGIDTSSVLDVDGGEYLFGPGASSATDTIITLSNNALIIGTITVDYSDPWVPGSGYTTIAEDAGGSIAPFSTIFQVVSAAGAYPVSWSWSPDTNSGCVYDAAFRSADAAGTGAAVVPARPLRSQMRW